MINVTKEQIKEVLERLHDYSHWMYYGEGASEHFRKMRIVFEDKLLNLSIRDDGDYEITLNNGTKCIYRVLALSSPLIEDSIDNVAIKCLIVNEADFFGDELEFVKRAGIFVCSAFQRAISFSFLSRMQPETIERITNDLSRVSNEN